MLIPLEDEESIAHTTTLARQVPNSSSRSRPSTKELNRQHRQKLRRRLRHGIEQRSCDNRKRLDVRALTKKKLSMSSRRHRLVTDRRRMLQAKNERRMFQLLRVRLSLRVLLVRGSNNKHLSLQ